MRLIAQQGAKAFYERHHEDCRQKWPHAGAVTLQTCAEYKVAEREPVRGTYRGHEVVTMPPPSSGSTHLVQNFEHAGAVAPGPVGPEQRAQTLCTTWLKAASWPMPTTLNTWATPTVKIPLKGPDLQARYAESLAKTIDPNPLVLPGDQAQPAPAVRKRPDHPLLGGGGEQRRGRDQR